MDGKHLRGSYDPDRGTDGELAGQAAQQQLTVARLDTRLVRAGGLQRSQGGRGGVGGTPGVRRLDIRDRCILFDALHTQRPEADHRRRWVIPRAGQAPPAAHVRGALGGS